MQGGTGLPEELLNPPQLLPGLELFFDAWWILDASRPSGWGPGRIPWDTVQRYANVQELSQDQTADLHFHIGRLDSVYLKWHADQQPKPNSGKG